MPADGSGLAGKHHGKAGPTGLGPKKTEEPCIIWSAVAVEVIAASRAAVPDALARVLSRPNYAILCSSCCKAIPIRAQTESMFRL